MDRLTKFLARAPDERALALEAAAWLAMSRLAVRFLPFRWIAPRLGRHMAVLPKASDPAHEEILKKVSWAVAAAARHVPWEAVCLPQAMAAKAMLRRRGIGSTLYLGISREERVAAHAWLRAGRRVITGGPVSPRYTIISTFS